MTVSELKIEHYRSLRYINMRLRRVNVIVGPNGSGKSNLYKSLKLLFHAAEGRFARSIVEEGGIESAMWAGPRMKNEKYRLNFSIKLESGLKYELQCGVPVLDETNPFPFDPIIKEEHVSFLDRGDKVKLLERKSMAVHARDNQGKQITYPYGASESESVIAELKEPHLFPELSQLRNEFLSWRFYHKFRTDDESPIRTGTFATKSMIMQHDASDLAAALKTILWVGDSRALQACIDQAFPGSSLDFAEFNGMLSVALRMPGLHRPLEARELSDGTLHYLCLLAALLSPRPAGLIALNEPEASIHPDLLVPLADLIKAASKESQLWIITHSFRLAELIGERCNVEPFELEKLEGATRIKRRDGVDEE